MSNWDKKSDQELIKDYLNGEKLSLEILIAKYLDDAYRFAFDLTREQETAEDIVQESFVKFWKSLSKFDPKKEVKPWLLTIIKNTAIDFFRKKSLIPFSSFEKSETDYNLLEQIKDKKPLPSEEILKKEFRQEIRDLISKLSQKDQEILNLRYQKTMTFKEISSFLKSPINTIKSRHRRSLIFLKKLIEEDDAPNIY